MKGQELAQSRPSDTTAVSVLSPDGNEVIHITQIIVSNTTTSDAKWSIFKDEDGTTYDKTTSHFTDILLPANSTDIIEYNAWMNDNSGNFAVKSDPGDAITFTIDGELLIK